MRSAKCAQDCSESMRELDVQVLVILGTRAGCKKTNATRFLVLIWSFIHTVVPFFFSFPQTGYCMCENPSYPVIFYSKFFLQQLICGSCMVVRRNSRAPPSSSRLKPHLSQKGFLFFSDLTMYVRRCTSQASEWWTQFNQFFSLRYVFIGFFPSSFLFLPFLHSSIVSFIISFFHSFIHSPTHSFIRLCMHACIHSCMHAFIHSFIDSAFMHACIHSFIQSASISQ